MKSDHLYSYFNLFCDKMPKVKDKKHFVWTAMAKSSNFAARVGYITYCSKNILELLNGKICLSFTQPFQVEQFSMDLYKFCKKMNRTYFSDNKNAL